MSKACEYCEKPLPEDANGHQRFCNRNCRQLAWVRRGRQSVVAQPDRCCRFCGKPFPADAAITRVYCDRKCRNKQYLAEGKRVGGVVKKQRRFVAEKGHCKNCGLVLDHPAVPDGNGRWCGWCVQEARAFMELVKVLKEMPTKGVRLTNGLALRLVRDAAIVTLSCSRVEVVPSPIEVKVVAEAAAEAFGLEVVWSEDAASSVMVDGSQHWVRRLFWPRDRVSVVYPLPVQQPLIEIEDEKKHVYE